MAGLPLLFALESAGVTVHLSNLAFTDSEAVTSEQITPICHRVSADDTKKLKGYLADQDYWPELFVSQWFRKERKQERSVYMLDRAGVVPMQAAYARLWKTLELDAIVLVDGGTDSLMFGNEAGLGTPEEDMCSIAAVSGVGATPEAKASGLKTFLLCIGFGIDCYHGVSHHDFLKNVATLQKCTPSGYLGSFSLHGQLHEEAKLARECFMACDPGNSIVNSCMLHAAEGHFGNVHPPATAARTRGSQLYLSPLMAQYWAFRLETVAAHIQYMDAAFRNTQTYDQVVSHIRRHRKQLSHVLPKLQIPY